MAKQAYKPEVAGSEYAFWINAPIAKILLVGKGEQPAADIDSVRRRTRSWFRSFDAACVAQDGS